MLPWCGSGGGASTPVVNLMVSDGQPDLIGSRCRLMVTYGVCVWVGGGGWLFPFRLNIAVRPLLV